MLEVGVHEIGSRSILRYQTIDNLLKVLKAELKNIDSIDDYLKLFNNAHILYHILRCPLVHEQQSHFLIESAYRVDGSIRLSPLSKMTPDLIDEALREILAKWKSE